MNSPSKDKTKKFLIPGWLPENDTSKNEADEKIKDAILKILSETQTSSLISTTKKLISIDTLNEASELLLFALHELLYTRIKNFPVVLEAESELGLVYALKKFLYPITMSASH